MVTGGKNDPPEQGAVGFAHTLDTLKQNGSALLVVGSVPDEAYLSASRQMLGDPAADPPRRRVLVVPESEAGRAADRLGEAVSSNWTRFVRYGSTTRSAAVESAGPTGTIDWHRSWSVDASIVDLGTAVSGVIEEYDRAAGGLEPAELRLAFDCIPALLGDYPREAVFRLLHVLTAHVRWVSGMGHFRLPRARESELARLFAPLFDATIELRFADGELMQRWRFRDTDLVSDWLPLEV